METNKNLGLSWFAGRFAVTISERNDANRALRDFFDEVSARPHLRNGAVMWDAENKRLIVTLEYKGISAKQASEQIAEELFEIANAVLESVQGLRVEILDVSLLTDS